MSAISILSKFIFIWFLLLALFSVVFSLVMGLRFFEIYRKVLKEINNLEFRRLSSPQSKNDSIIGGYLGEDLIIIWDLENCRGIRSVRGSALNNPSRIFINFPDVIRHYFYYKIDKWIRENVELKNLEYQFKFNYKNKIN